MDERIKNKTGYEGNGWSRYQILVLQQLEDHSALLQSMNCDIGAIKQQAAVSDNNAQNRWERADTAIRECKRDTDRLITDLRKSITDVEEVTTTLDKRITIAEGEKLGFENHAVRSRTLWSAIIALVAALMGLSFEVIKTFFLHHP